MPKKSALALVDLPFRCRFDASRYSRSHLLAHLSEKKVQSEIIKFLRDHLVDVVDIDAGGKKARGRLRQRLKDLGHEVDESAFQGQDAAAAPTGWPDLEATLAPSGRSLYIEVKRPAWTDSAGKIIKPAGEPTQAQVDRLLDKHRRGAIVCVAWSLQDVKEALGEFLRDNLLFMLSADKGRISAKMAAARKN